jgi:sugar O-acyltransferase (sialic acid O-acetyltransferase NeuD family)
VVADVARACGLEIAGFVDDDEGRSGARFFGSPVLTLRQWMERPSWPASIALGVGDNVRRAECVQRLETSSIEPLTLVHPRSVVSPSARLGSGTVVMAGAIVNPDATVGVGVILNTASVTEHDVVLGDFAHLSPNAALGGAARVGAFSHVGIGAAVLPGITIGARVRVGGGAVVIRHVADGLTVVGVPARPVRPGGA